MDKSKINVRYSKAFFSLAREKNLIGELQKDAGLISSVCTSSSDFILLIESPVIPVSEKMKALKAIFEGKINLFSLNFLLLITQNRRERNIPGIFRDLEELYKQDQGIKTAVLTTAKPINETLVDQIRKSLENEFGGIIQLSQNIDEDLIGGFVLRVDDNQYDASISSQLRRIKEKLLQTELK
ncbi:MAG: ATP synthase F1 subunit delta [Bacteroidota bacterium]|nr:ATP synthase F1 subunit delta [Bacteroidota bacterium]